MKSCFWKMVFLQTVLIVRVTLAPTTRKQKELRFHWYSLDVHEQVGMQLEGGEGGSSYQTLAVNVTLCAQIAEKVYDTFKTLKSRLNTAWLLVDNWRIRISFQHIAASVHVIAKIGKISADHKIVGIFLIIVAPAPYKVGPTRLEITCQQYLFALFLPRNGLDKAAIFFLLKCT